MGSTEKKATKRIRRNALKNGLLATLLIAGAAGVAVTAPNALVVLKYIDPQWVIKPNPKQRLRECASRLKKAGFVEFRKKNGKTTMILTKKGHETAHTLELETLTPIIPKRWDGRWRIVIFDIPEKQKRMREKIRTIIGGMGFVRLQDSVWAFPYDCEENIAIIKLNLRIGSKMLYMIADIEYDKPLREYFKLKEV